MGKFNKQPDTKNHYLTWKFYEKMPLAIYELKKIIFQTSLYLSFDKKGIYDYICVHIPSLCLTNNLFFCCYMKEIFGICHVRLVKMCFSNKLIKLYDFIIRSTNFISLRYKAISLTKIDFLLKIYILIFLKCFFVFNYYILPFLFLFFSLFMLYSWLESHACNLPYFNTVLAFNMD